ncbi:thiol reductant ABC exporter subunit CydD [Marivivens donghaensis]|jgi:ATP-binding cassette, subfamily C, bacterial CydD|uniref:thiol reductant ABC exporter subunit CydD n=1 Tax=Marivivens donghaensis TaxID=1699413 RepID=UPI003F6A4DE8
MSTDPNEFSLKQLTRSTARTLWVSSGLAMASNMIWLLQAYLIASIVSGMLSGDSFAWIQPEIAGFLFLGSIKAFFSYLSDKKAAEAADTIQDELRREIIGVEASETGASFSFGAGATSALLVEKVALLRPYVLRYFPARVRTMAVPTVILLIAFYYSWAVGVILLITGPLIPLFMALIGWAAQTASEQQMQEVSTMNDLLVDRVSGLVDIRLLNASQRVLSDFETHAEDLRTRTMVVLRIAFLSSTVLELFAAIGVALVAVFLGFSLLGEINFGSTGAPVTAFEVVWLLLLAPEFYQPLRDLSAAWHDRASAAAVAKDIHDWREQKRAVIIQPAGSDGGAFSGLNTRSLSVEVGETVLQFPDIDIARGSSVAIIGPSGSGKTTYLRTLAGLTNVHSGEVRSGDVDLSQKTIKNWRGRIGWMPQAPSFLNETLRYNVAFDETADIWPSLKLARVDSVVKRLPDQDRTCLGENGAGLSGGEARRIMLARAVFASPDILIADEPTADLDRETANLIIESLNMLRRSGVTVIVATHDEVLAGYMDQQIRFGDDE